MLPGPSEASLTASTPYRLQLCRVSEGLANKQPGHHSTLTKPSRHVPRLEVLTIISLIRKARHIYRVWRWAHQHARGPSAVYQFSDLY